MAILCIKLEDTKTARSFIKATNKRLQVDHLVNNPFRGFVTSKWKDEDFMAILSMSPVYPSPTKLGIVLFIIYLFLFKLNLSWWILVPSLITGAGIFWSKYFFYAMFVLGLRKNGYTGKTKLLNNNDIFIRVLGWGNKK